MELISIALAALMSLVMALAVGRIVRFFLRKDHVAYSYKLMQDPKTGKVVETVVVEKSK